MSDNTTTKFKEIVNLIPPIIRKNTKQAQKAVPLSDAEKEDIANVIILGYQDSIRLLKKYVSSNRYKSKEQKDEYLIKAIYFVTYRLYAQYYGFTDAEKSENFLNDKDKRKHLIVDMNGGKVKVSKGVQARYERLNKIGIDADYIIDDTDNPLFVSKGLVKFFNDIPYEISPIDFQTRVLMDLGMYRVNPNSMNGKKETIGSKNTWTKWGISPQKDYEKNYYTPVKILFYYNGKKHNELGYMLNSLVRQSGADYFYDLFGGSGTATLSVIPLKYNYLSDIEPNIYNFYNVLKNECPTFKSELRALIDRIDNAPHDKIFDIGEKELKNRFENRVLKRVLEFKNNLEEDIKEIYPDIIPLAKEKFYWMPNYNLVTLNTVDSHLQTLRNLIELLPDGNIKEYYLFSGEEDLNSYIDRTPYALDYLEDEYKMFTYPNPSLIYALGLYRVFIERDDEYFHSYKENYMELSKANGIANDVAEYFTKYINDKSNPLFAYPQPVAKKAAEFYYLHCFAFSGAPSIAGVTLKALSKLKVSLDIEHYRDKVSYIIDNSTDEELETAEALINNGISGLEIASERLQRVELNLSNAHSILYKTLQNVTAYHSLRVNNKKLTHYEIRNLGVLDREECLFYADPPYPGTVEYRTNTATEEKTEEKAENPDSFNFDLFYQDIQNLKSAKWIISCEAGVSKRAKGKLDKTSKSRVVDNATKVRNFFTHFKGYADFVVFPISQKAYDSKKKKSNTQFAVDFLTKEIKNYNKVEVMLTNFEVNCPDKQFARTRGCETNMDYNYSQGRNLGYCKIDYELFYSTVEPLLSHLIEQNKPENK